MPDQPLVLWDCHAKGSQYPEWADLASHAVARREKVWTLRGASGDAFASSGHCEAAKQPWQSPSSVLARVGGHCEARSAAAIPLDDSPFGKLIFTHNRGCWTQGGL